MKVEANFNKEYLTGSQSKLLLTNNNENFLKNIQ